MAPGPWSVRTTAQGVAPPQILLNHAPPHFLHSLFRHSRQQRPGNRGPDSPAPPPGTINRFQTGVMGFGLPAELTTTTGLLTFLRLYAQAGAQTPEPVHLSPRDRGQPEPRL